MPWPPTRPPASNTRHFPPSHQAEYLTWIDEAKRLPTRERHIAGMIERLTAQPTAHRTRRLAARAAASYIHPMNASKTRLAVAAGAVVVIAAVVAVSLHRPNQPPPVPPVPAQTAAPPAAPAVSQGPPPADCLLPGPPPVPPNGAIATADDMKLGHDVMQHFVEELEAYQACRNAQIDHAAKTVSDQQKETWLDQGNSAVDEAHALADAFSEQLKTFKARPGSPP